MSNTLSLNEEREVVTVQDTVRPDEEDFFTFPKNEAHFSSFSFLNRQVDYYFF